MAEENVAIVKATSENTDQVINLLKENFITREPLCKALGLEWDKDMRGFAQGVKGILDQGCSFVALNASGRVIGVRLSAVMEIDKNKDPEPDYVEISDKTDKMQLLGSMFRTLMSGWTKELPDSRVIMEFIQLCVDDQYGGRAIAQRLVDKSLLLAEELQVDYVYTVSTSWKSQRVFDKLGFTTVRIKNYDDFVDKEGNPVLKMHDGSTCMKWMVKKIKKHAN